MKELKVDFLKKKIKLLFDIENPDKLVREMNENHISFIETKIFWPII